MTTAIPTDAALTRDETRHRPRCCCFRFRLRTFLLAFTVVTLGAGYVAWLADVVNRRQQLIHTSLEHEAYVIMSWEDDPSFPYRVKDFRSLTIYSLFDGWHARTTDPTTSFVRSNPIDRQRLSLPRRWLGDRRVDNIFLTNPDAFAVYRAAFPEAMIVVDPAAEARILAWEQTAISTRGQLTILP